MIDKYAKAGIIGKGLRWLTTGGKAPVAAKSGRLKHYADRMGRVATRKADRKDKFRTMWESFKGNPQAGGFGRAAGDYGKTFGKHLGEYGKQSLYDLRHPIRSLGDYGTMITHKYDPKLKGLVRRSPLGTAGSAALLGGLPLSYGYGEYKTRRKKGHGMARSIAGGLPQVYSFYASPYVGASLLVDAPLRRAFSLRDRKMREAQRPITEARKQQKLQRRVYDRYTSNLYR